MTLILLTSYTLQAKGLPRTGSPSRATVTLWRPTSSGVKAAVNLLSGDCVMVDGRVRPDGARTLMEHVPPPGGTLAGVAPLPAFCGSTVMLAGRPSAHALSPGPDTSTWLQSSTLHVNGDPVKREGRPVRGQDGLGSADGIPIAV